MFYDVVYYMGNNEGFDIKTFDSISEALHFADKQVESRIYGYFQAVPLSFNITLLYK